MDNSRRSSHGNAYFTGFGAAKRIVLFDTLISRLSAPEIEASSPTNWAIFHAVTCGSAWASRPARSLVILWLLGWLIGQEWFYAALGVRSRSTAMALVLFFMVVPVFTFLLQPLASWYSRLHEFEADAYAARVADPATLRAPWSSSIRTMRRRWRRTPCIRLSTILTRRRCCASRGCKLNGPRRRNMSTLAGRKCRPLPAGTPASRARESMRCSRRCPAGLTTEGHREELVVQNYYETLAFVNAVAWLVHREDHHPDMSVGYNRCRVEFSTHSIGGISENDFICATKSKRSGRFDPGPV